MRAFQQRLNLVKFKSLLLGNNAGTWKTHFSNTTDVFVLPFLSLLTKILFCLPLSLILKPLSGKDKAFFLEPYNGQIYNFKAVILVVSWTTAQCCNCGLCALRSTQIKLQKKCFYNASKTCAKLLMKRKGGEPHEHADMCNSLKSPACTGISILSSLFVASLGISTEL